MVSVRLIEVGAEVLGCEVKGDALGDSRAEAVAMAMAQPVMYDP
jgi:hypothetical protein